LQPPALRAGATGMAGPPGPVRKLGRSAAGPGHWQNHPFGVKFAPTPFHIEACIGNQLDESNLKSDCPSPPHSVSV
jgi:hypothetical protein